MHDYKQELTSLDQLIKSSEQSIKVFEKSVRRADFMALCSFIVLMVNAAINLVELKNWIQVGLVSGSFVAVLWLVARLKSMHESIRQMKRNNERISAVRTTTAASFRAVQQQGGQWAA